MAVNPSTARTTSTISALLARPAAEQLALGYGHTLREILQQPELWLRSAEQLTKDFESGSLADFVNAASSIVLTGSGSSHYIGESLAIGLQSALQKPVQAVPAGTLLTHWRGLLPSRALLVSFARSGDSPESYGVVDTLLAGAPDCRHLVITCNARGRLATRYRDQPSVRVIVLDERTNDHSLVMTSSFTNLVLAGRAIGAQDGLAAYQERARRASQLCQHLFDTYVDALDRVARRNYSNVAYLGSGVRYGSAREAALKMLEMSGGDVPTFAETFLGLRHGPMSSLSRESLVVAFVSGDAGTRAYELDLLRELSRKDLGTAKVLVGEALPKDIVGAQDVVIDLPGLTQLGDEDAPLLDVAVGQWLGFFRCLHLGHKPDAPSQGVLTRVVDNFDLYQGPDE